MSKEVDTDLYKEIGKMEANIKSLTETSARIEAKVDRLIWKVAGVGGTIGSIVAIIIFQVGG